MINVKELTLKYSPEICAIDNVSFHIKKGEAVALLGANGAGKSTLISAMLGLIDISSGSIEIDKIKLEQKNISNIRKKIGLIFQKSDEQLFCHSVKEDIAFGISNGDLSKEEIEEKVEEIAQKLNITKLLSRNCQSLSEGEKKLCALAGVLIMNVDIIIFDESDAMLDPRSKRHLAEIINALPQTKIIATHNLDFAKKVSTKSLILKDSKLIKFAPNENILNDINFLSENYLY
ncbi:MAG: ABC transporter ATP-binding protein [Opitutales bacterium]